MKYCAMCGVKSEDIAKFCTKCGYKFKEFVDDDTVTSENTQVEDLHQEENKFDEKAINPVKINPQKEACEPVKGNIGAEACAEKVVIAFPVSYKKGIFSQKGYTIVITQSRVIFAEYTNKMAKEAAEIAAKEAKEQGKGFFGKMMSTMGSAFNYYRKYFSMNPEDIIRETPDNFFIYNSSIEKIKFREAAIIMIMMTRLSTIPLK